MKLPRRRLLHLAAGAVALPAISRIASALDYTAETGKWAKVIKFAGIKPD